MQIDLSALEIFILLKCSQGIVSRSALSQIRRNERKTKKEKAINNLIKKGYIIAKELPRLDAYKTPIFYEITPKGKKWVDDYMASYPTGC